MAVPPTMPIEGLKSVKAADACVAAMREAVGDDIDIMVDCHARPSPAMGMQFAKALDPYGLYFLEEPCWCNLQKLEQLLAVVKNGSHLQAEEAIFQAYGAPLEQVQPLILAGLQHPHWSVRQAVAGIIADIPENLRPQFEALLEDDFLKKPMVVLV